MKALGRLCCFLGIEVAHSNHGSKSGCMLKEIRKIECRLACIPMYPNVKLGVAEEDNLVNQGHYQCLICKLLYFNHARLDITYTVSIHSQYMSNPSEIHLQATYRVIHYLKETIEKGLLFKKGGSCD